MTAFTLTEKQKQITNLVITGNPDGSFCDLDEIRERLSYTPSKEALQFSIRYLVRKGVIEKRPLESRRGQKRRVIAPSPLAYRLLRAI
jgi:hypothetical protein